MGKSGLDTEGYRTRVAGAVGMAVGELIASRRDDPTAVMQRMVAAHFLFKRDQVLIGDIARIMNKSETWVYDARDYIERRISHYYAFRVYIERTIATYALAST